MTELAEVEEHEVGEFERPGDQATVIVCECGRIYLPALRLHCDECHMDTTSEWWLERHDCTSGPRA